MRSWVFHFLKDASLPERTPSDRSFPIGQQGGWNVPMERPGVRFDTHVFFKKLVAAGIPRQQADALVCSLVQLMKCRLAITTVI